MMKHNKNYITIMLVALVLFATIGIGIVAGKTIKELTATKASLQLKEVTLLEIQEKLAIAQENYQFEIKKSTDLNEKIDSMTSELDEANEMLNILKSEEYNIAYLGEFVYTYYCDERYPHICGYGLGLTGSGAPTEVGTTIAVDPSVIPIGATVYIEGIGLRVAQDTGGAVKGAKIDILLPTHDECFEQTLINGGVWIVSKKTP